MLWQWELTRRCLRSYNQSRSFDQPDQLLPKPCSDQLPYEQHSTNELLANEWPVNCQTPPHWWTNQWSTKSILSNHVLNTQTFPSISWWKTLGATLGGKPPNHGRKLNQLFQDSLRAIMLPMIFWIWAVGGKKKKKKIKQEGILTGWPCPLSLLLPFFPKQHTFLKYFLHAAAFFVLFLETSV